MEPRIEAASRAGSWSTRQLAEFLTLISQFDDERTATRRGLERVTEVLEAEAAALVRSGAVLASVGLPPGDVPTSTLVAVAEGRRDELEIPGAGSCTAVSVPLEGDRPLHLVVVRRADERFSGQELDLLGGMCRVLTLGLRGLRLLENERVLREQSERQASENKRLLSALRERQALSERLSSLQREAFHDSVTGLPNRALFLDRLKHALARGERSSVRVGVLFIDLDGFKTVNASLGHAAGDQLLRAVAERLAARLRPADTVARIGGDEFAVLLEEVGDPTDAASTAGRILETFEAPFELRTRELYVSASVGIAMGRGSADDLLRNADLAMSRAKSQGKGRYEVYEPAMHAAIVDRLELEVDAKRALEREELEIQYQPIFNLRTGQVHGLEALVRWHHPTRGLVLPSRFVPLAEETGQILRLGRWVLDEACRRAALWRAKYPAYGSLEISVNLSGAQLKSPGLVDEVRMALASAQLDPGSLALEITETVLTEDAVSIAALDRLRELGVRLAIDDFGTGYSSLQYLSRFPIDTLKIAKVFVDDLGKRAEQPALARAIIELAGIFDLRVIAEGIERAEQQEALLALGCEVGQGHHFSGPLSATDADALLFRAGLLGGPRAGAETPRAESLPDEVPERADAGHDRVEPPERAG